MSETLVEDKTQDISRIGVLDGIRVISMLFVVWFHFWQQTWLTPGLYFDSTIGKVIGLDKLSLAAIVRYGYDFVDVLILISAICNFLPYAKAIVYKTQWPSWKDFYKKRAIRILPSYYFALIVILIIQLANSTYTDASFMNKDIICRFTMSSIFFPDTFNNSNLNGVLWTVQIEFWFYVLIPWIALAFKKIPVVISTVMYFISAISIGFIINCIDDYNCSYYKDFPLTYCFLYVIGMFIGLAYYYFHKHCKENVYTKTIALIAIISCVYGLSQILSYYNSDNQAYVQLNYRMTRGILFAVIIFALLFSFNGIKKIFSNKVMFMLASISYNYYIWHQFLAVQLKKMRIPYWEGDTPPNILGDYSWSWKYNWIIILVSLVISVLCTYCLEKPVARWLKRKLNV